MKITTFAISTSVLIGSVFIEPAPVSAGTIERACLSSGRSAANRPLCGCIQQAADLTLSNSDQRKAAGLFKNPQKAQDIRQSDNRSNEAFWKRYKSFGSTASKYCG